LVDRPAYGDRHGPRYFASPPRAEEPVLGFRPFLYLALQGERFALSKRETSWLLAELIPRERPAGDTRAVIAGMRIQEACKSGRGRQLSLQDADAGAVLAALDRGEQRGELTGRLYALQLALRETLRAGD
jgi:hypothetical protein